MSRPPAEAQPVACDEDRFEQFLQAAIARSPEPLRELGEYLAGVLDDDQWPAADRLLLQLAAATPSAPVGVEAVVADMRRWVRLAEASGPYAAGRTVVVQEWANQLEALAQKPAPTLPDVDDDDLTVAYMAGRHDGRKEAQQPAAVDGAMVARFLEAYRDTPGDEAIDADEKVARRWLTAALAAQQGGRSDDR